MALTVLSTTTITNALTDKERRFAVGSTTNISAGNFITVGAELMLVQAIPVSGWVEVQRGYGGTEARPHLASTTVHIGTGDKFAVLSEPKALGLSGVDSVAGKPEFILPVNQYRQDPDTGYVYLLCSFAGALVAGEWAHISSAGAATALAAAGKGRVGIVVEAVAASSYSWVLVQGIYATAACESEITSALRLGAVASYAGAWTSNNEVLIHAAYFTEAADSCGVLSVGEATASVTVNHPWTDNIVFLSGAE